MKHDVAVQLSVQHCGMYWWAPTLVHTSDLIDANDDGVNQLSRNELEPSQVIRPVLAVVHEGRRRVTE